MENTRQSATGDRFQQMMDEAPVGILFFTPVRDQMGNLKNFKLERYNKKTDELMGCILKEGASFYIEDLLQANDEVSWMEIGRRVYDTGEPIRDVLQFNNTCDERVNRVQMEKNGNGLAVYLTDIHELHQTVEKLQKDEKKYRLLFETSLDGIFLADKAFNVVSFNPRFSALFSYDQYGPEIPLKLFFKSADAYNRFTSWLAEKKFVQEFETILITSRGGTKPCLINCIPALDERGNISFYQGVVRDITAKKRTEKELVMAEKLSLTGKLARTIAHEVRNPLTNLRLALDQISDELPADFEDGAFYFNMIRRSADRIEQLITDLLHSSRPKELLVSDEDINALIEETVLLVKDRLRLKSMTLDMYLDREAPRFKCDKDQLKVALLNLLLNAVEAMEPGKGVLTLRTHYNDEQLEIAIRDNGRGITEEELEHLFEAFFTAKKQGTGLGLTTTQNIIRAHKGTIDVLSETGIGTEFTVRLYKDRM